jgi:RHS repeat-associated protein
MIQEGPSASVADRTYVHGARVDEIVASQVSGVWYNHHYDAQGNCILLSTASGGLQEQYDYDAFGYPYFYTATGSKAGNVKTRFLFTGREWLPDLRIYDYRARLYQPELGRFLQPDPKEFGAGDYNLYRYCHNDPVNRIDPEGLQVVDTLTGWGGGDWIKGGNVPARDAELINQGHVDRAIKTFEKQTNAGSPNVRWSAHVNHTVEPGENFKGTKDVYQTAVTSWKTASTATADGGGNINKFSVDLQILVRWNGAADGRFRVMALGTGDRGEFAHTQHALDFVRHSYVLKGESRPAARDIANDAAAEMIGSPMSTGDAGARMQSALSPWVESSQEMSRRLLDPPYSEMHHYIHW